MTTVEPDVPLVPVSMTCKVERGAPVQCTLYLQLPRIQTKQAKKTLTISDGGTALFAGWKETREGRNEFGPPMLSRIPYVKRLVTNVAYDQATYTTYFLVTPQIVVNPMGTVRADAVLLLPPPASDPTAHAAIRGTAK